jgi:hypothetical protein
MRHLFTFIFAAILTWSAIGQNIVIEGQVVDYENADPLTYAHVFLKDLKKGTITDLDGKFRMTVEEHSLSDTLKVSMIGFSTYKISIQDYLNGNSNVIKLKNKVTQIKQVVITNGNIKKQSGLAKKMVENAIDKITKNYPTRPYLLQGYFRTAYKENGTYARLHEVTFDLYDAGYHTRYTSTGNLITDIKEVRKSNDYRQYKFDDRGDYIDLILRSCNDIRNQKRIMNKELHRYYSFAMDKITELDGKKIYIIKAIPNELVYNNRVNSGVENYTPFVKLYIREGDYAITKIESDYSHLVGKWNSFGGVTDTTYSKNTEYYTTYQYAEFDGKWYLYYKSYSREWEVYDNRSNKKIADYAIEEETIFDERSARASVPKRLQDEVLTHNFTSPSNIYKKEFPYHASYWKNSNKNVKTRLFRDAKIDLQQHKPLEEQFEENGVE